MKYPTLFSIQILVLTFFSAAGQNSYSGKPIQLKMPGEVMRQELTFPGAEQAIQLCKLKKGESYTVWAVGPKECQPELALADGSQSGQTFSFIASADCVEFIMKKGGDSSLGCWSEPVRFSIASAKGKSKKSDFLAKANLSVAGGQSPQTLIQDVFIGGGCFDVTGATGIGSANGRGSFANGTGSIALDQGVILSTGNITNAPGPNNSNSAGNQLGGGGDPDLAQIAGGPVFDAVGIEFDFQPTISQIDFMYVFASEEYCEYAPPNNTGYNDVFGFFISGPGINGGFLYGGQNIALLPGTSFQVGINTVNPVNNSSFFVPNQGNCGGTTNMAEIQFDGWTTVLTAVANVIPCETYHIRLVIGDVGDGIYDSAVFLGANTFSAGGTAIGSAISASSGTNIAYEPCNDASFVFTRAGGDINIPLVIDFSVLSSSTATPGVDYAPLPSSVVIPAGSTQFILPVTIFNDNIPEGIETIVLSLTNSCSCSSFEITLEIHDPPPLQAELPDIEECAGVPIFLGPSIEGGIPGSTYTYLWNNGATTPVNIVTPLVSTTYTVTVTGSCGQTATATTTVNVAEVPVATLSGSAMLCANDPEIEAELPVTITGTPPWELTYAINGTPQPPILVYESPYFINATIAGYYELLSVTALIGNCNGIATGVAPVIVSSVDVSVSMTPVTCQGAGTMTADATGGQAPYSYTWSNNFPNSPTAYGLVAGTYTVTVSDLSGCTGTASGTITEIPPMELTATAMTGTDCANPNGGSINLEIVNGLPPLSFFWSGGAGNAQNPTGLAAGTYTVTVTDYLACSATATATIVANNTPPIATASSADMITCVNATAGLSGQGSSTGPDISYLWSGPEVSGNSTTINSQARQPGAYSLLVTNAANGCTAVASVTIIANLDVPLATATGSELTCSEPQIQIDGTGSSPGMNYQWTGPGIVSGGNTLSPIVNQQGTYTLTVTDPVNGCSATTQAVVTSSLGLPTATIAPPPLLTCTTTNVILDGSGSSSGADFSYQWFFGNAPVQGASNSTLEAQSPGTYQIVVTDQTNGCTAGYSIQVNEDTAPPDVSAAASGEITCAISSVQVTATVAGNMSDYTFEWTTPDGLIIGGSNSYEATASAPGTYEVLVTNSANGCTSTASTLVNQDANIIDILIAPSANLDCLTPQIQLNGTGSSQGATLVYQWTTQDGNFVSGENTLTPTVNAPGVYTLTIWDTTNACENTDSITVVLDDLTPALSIAPAATLDCNTTSITINGSVSNLPLSDLDISWTTADGLINGPSNVLNPEVSQPGSYTLLVTNVVNGCTEEASITVSQDIEQPLAQVAAPDTLTCAVASVNLNGTSSSTGAAFNYQWTTPDGSIASGANTLTAVVDMPGIYDLLITNSVNGCTGTAQVVVLQDVTQPEANAGSPATLTCSNPQLNLSGNGSAGSLFEYSWSGPGIVSGANTLTPTINQPGQYVLLVTNVDNACTQTSLVNISQDIATPVAEAGLGGQLSCTINQISLDAEGSSVGAGFQYLWTSVNGNITSGKTTLTPVVNAPGIYNLLVTNTENGCTSTDQVEITVDDDLPTVNAGTAEPITCLITEVTLDGSGSSAGQEFIYEWSTANGSIVSGVNSLNPVVNAPGTYVLAVTNTNTNCINLASVTVQAQTAPPPAEAGTTAQLTCTAPTTSLNGAGSATGPEFLYQWSTQDGNILSGATTLIPTIDQPGTYLLQVTNTTTGCTNTDQVVITQSVDTPVAAATAPDFLSCVILTLTLDGAGSSIGSDFNYLWSTTNGNIVSGENTLSPVVSQPGTYELLVTNWANGCTETTQVDVLQDVQPPTAEAGIANQLTCKDQTVTLNGAGSSIGPDFKYQWSTTDGHLVSGENTLMPTVNLTGTYTLTVTNQLNGCTASDIVAVSQNIDLPQALITPPDLLTCAVTAVTIHASASQGVEFQYNWTTTNGHIASGADGLSPLVDAPGTYLLTVANLLNGCSKEWQTTVNQDVQKPVANAGSAFVMDCFEEVNYLDGSKSLGNGAISFSWSTTDGSLVSGLNTAAPGVNLPGTYLLIVTNLQNGCTDSDQVTITKEGPTVAPSVLQPLCFGDKGTINLSGTTDGTPPYLSSIDGGLHFSTQNVFKQLTPGNYDIIVQDARGCKYNTSANIEEPNQLKVALEPEVRIKLGESYQINTSVSLPLTEISQVNWFPSTNLSCSDCLNPLATPATTMLYKVKVVSINGCKDEAPILLRVDKRGGIFVPNAFSPNGDGTNDIFMIYSDLISVKQIKSFLVFNRWGETVFQYFQFEPNNPAYGWDGKHRGEYLNPDVFTWMAVVEYIDGREEILKGDVMLMK